MKKTVEAFTECLQYISINALFTYYFSFFAAILHQDGWYSGASVHAWVWGCLGVAILLILWIATTVALSAEPRTKYPVSTMLLRTVSVVLSLLCCILLIDFSMSNDFHVSTTIFLHMCHISTNIFFLKNYSFSNSFNEIKIIYIRA